MKKVKAIFVFCEGPHDVAFVSNVLQVINKFKEIGKKSITELPHPLQKHYVNKNYEYEPITDIQGVVDPYMPKSVLMDKDEKAYFILYPCGGLGNIKSWNRQKEKNLQVPKEIEKLKQVITDELEKIKFREELSETKKLSFNYKNKEIPIVEMIAVEPVFGFVVDADDDLAEARLKQIKENYEKYFGDRTFNIQGVNEWNTEKNLGLFIFHREADKKGSLEDLVVNLLQEKETYTKFFPHFESKIQITSPNDKEHLSAVKIKRDKSALCSSGQHSYAGSSLAVILADSDKVFLDESKIESDPQCQAIAKFFQDVVE